MKIFSFLDQKGVDNEIRKRNIPISRIYLCEIESPLSNESRPYAITSGPIFTQRQH